MNFSKPSDLLPSTGDFGLSLYIQKAQDDIYLAGSWERTVFEQPEMFYIPLCARSGGVSYPISRSWPVEAAKINLTDKEFFEVEEEFCSHC